MERFKNAIFKQREEVNSRMAEMFELLKELTASQAPRKVLVREEARHPITKHVKSISLIRIEEEKSVRNNEVVNESVVEPDKSDIAEPLEEVDNMNEAENRTDDELVRSAEEKLMINEEEELVGVSSSRPIGYYLKHKINEKLIESLVESSRKDNKKEDMGGNFVIPCNVGGLKHMDALVDQGYNVNVMPLSIYNRLTDERHAETDIRLSLASHSYIYPLGIAEDVLIEVAGYVYPVNFVILDIKEDENRPFILGTPFLTTAKAVIKFDKETITIRSRKNKISFHKRSEPLRGVEREHKNNIEPISPTTIINRLVLE
ncbi:MAK10-like protein [Tanacetum coccineum]